MRSAGEFRTVEKNMTRLLVSVKLQKTAVFMYGSREKSCMGFGLVKRHFFRLLRLGYALQYEKKTLPIL